MFPPELMYIFDLIVNQMKRLSKIDVWAKKNVTHRNYKLKYKILYLITTLTTSNKGYKKEKKTTK